MRRRLGGRKAGRVQSHTERALEQPNDDLEVGKRRIPHRCQDDGGASVSRGKRRSFKGGRLRSPTSKRRAADVAAGCCASRNRVLLSKALIVEAVTLVATDERERCLSVKASTAATLNAERCAGDWEVGRLARFNRVLELLTRRERAAACRPGDGPGTVPSGAFPGRRTTDSELVRTTPYALTHVCCCKNAALQSRFQVCCGTCALHQHEGT